MTALLNFPASQAGYGVIHPNQVVSIELDGGPPRLRSDAQRANGHVSVSWLLDRVEYTNFLTFWRQDLQHGALPMLVDIVTETFQRARHRATFVPGTLRTTQVAGLTYRITADLRVEQFDAINASVLFGDPNIVSASADLDLTFEPLDKIQIIGAQLNDGTGPAIDLDGIYTVLAFNFAYEITLNSPASINADWNLLASYPGGLTGYIPFVTLVNSPT